MNIVVHLLPPSERLKRIAFGSEGNAPSIYLNVSVHAIHSWYSFTTGVQGFLNELLQITFPNNVNAAKVNSPSESSLEERGGVSRAH